MNKRNLILIGVVGILIVGAVVAYVLRPPAEASTPIEAIPLEPTAAADMPAEAPMEEAVVESDADTAAADSEPQVQPETAEEQPAADPPAEETAPSGSLIFAISQAESQVSFTLDELLRNVPTTVVGISNQVAGEIAVDLANPANTQVGVIQINARTLETDNGFRNRAIQNEILDTGRHEFITFTPTGISGLPETVAIGDSFSFQLSGDLTIREITQPVTFAVSVTVASETRLEGSASATVLRSNFDLNIPDVPSVANVTDEVLLEINFVALAK